MKSKTTSIFVKQKIVFAYIILIIIGVFAVWIALKQVDKLSKPNDLYNRMNERSALVNTTLYYMYKSENDGMLLFLGKESVKSDYESDLCVIYNSLDTLKSYASDSDQAARIDSIVALFSIKENTMQSILKSADLGTYHKEVNERIVKFMPDTSELKRKMLGQTKTTITRDTIITKRKSGNFFKRVKEVFKKTRSDSTIVSSTKERHDSTYIALADSINDVLRNLRKDVIEMRNTTITKQRATWAKISQDNDAVNAVIYKLIKDFESEESKMLTDELTMKDAERISTVRSLSVILVIAGIVIIFFIWIIWRDLEKSNRYKKALEKLNQDNIALLDAREKLMLAITHDIKAPLSSIIGYTELLNRISSDKRQQLYLSNIKTSSDLLLALVTDLLEFYKLDSDKADLKSVVFNANEFFNSIYQLFIPVAEKKNLKMKYKAELKSDLYLESDPLKIKQIVNNLISNAIKFTDTGEIELSVAYNDSDLTINVRDTGRGISDNERDKLFKTFVRLSSATGVQGFGLGLSIVERTVKLLKGTIALDSKIGEGSCFTVVLPMVSTIGNSSVEHDNDNKSRMARNCSILLVDDDELQMNLVVEVCKCNNILADKCQYPSYASRMVEEKHYDMVITDIQMPEMNGFEVLKSVKSISENTPVIAVTARDVEREKYLEAGFSDVLTKPFREDDLLRIISDNTAFATEQKTISNSDSIGLSALYQFADGDENAKKEILNSFILQTEDNLKKFEDAVDRGDNDSIRSLCHKMLPLFSMIGENKTVEIMKIYEHDKSAVMPNDVSLDLKNRINSVLDRAKKEML